VREPSAGATISDEQRASLAARMRSVAHDARTFIDAWAVESAGRAPTPFAWRPANARRVIGAAALRRRAHRGAAVTDAVREEVDELLVRCAAGYARPGSLAHWLGSQRSAVVALVSAEAITWATTALEALEPTRLEFAVTTSDAFYDVAGARTTLKGRRDAVLVEGAERVVVRLRGGQPGRSAGPGLRADLVIDALASPVGLAARRIVGVWPDAGVALSVDGTPDDVAAGARDLVRAAVVRRRHAAQLAV